MQNDGVFSTFIIYVVVQSFWKIFYSKSSLKIQAVIKYSISVH